MDRIRQSHGGFYLCGGDDDELGGLVSSVLAGCTPPAATSIWTFPVIGNFSMVVKYNYDSASRVSASTFSVNGKAYFSGHTVTNYTGGDDDAMVLSSESTYMTEPRETFNATYEKVKTPEGKEVERMVGSSVYIPQLIGHTQETNVYTYDTSQSQQGWWLPATTKRSYSTGMEAVDQWTQTTFLAMDPATRFLTTVNATQQTSTDGGANTTTALSTTFTYNSNKQLVKKETVVTGQVPAMPSTFEYDAQVRTTTTLIHPGMQRRIRVFIISSCRGAWPRCQAQAAPPRTSGTPRRATPPACLLLTTPTL